VNARVDKKRELLDRYEATGDEAAYLEALPLYEEAARNGADPDTLKDYGYLLECHARNKLRRAVELYELAIRLDPFYDKPRYQLISARAGLQETELPIAEYEKELEAKPDEVRWYRLLASAYLKAHDYKRARKVIDRGLALAPDDPVLIESRAEARAGTGDREGALADWRRALELDPDHIGPLYMSAFLLERMGRRQEAIDNWQAIIDWSERRGYELDTIWPKQELERLRSDRSAN
jgi:tetratricopeptide (TPR) repeat protein